MLTAAIGFIQNIQLACFAVVFILIALHDRENRCFRWLAAAYCAGLVGGAFDLARHLLPYWIAVPASVIAAPVGYACIHAGVVHFLSRERRLPWFSAVLVAGALCPIFFWSLSLPRAFGPTMDRITTVQDLELAIQTALTSILLLTAFDLETRWPRRVLGVFLSVYSSVEFARVAVYLATGQLPDRAAPWVETASGIVYVVSCSVLPLNFIWMQNARLHAHMTRQMTTDALTRLLNRRGLNQAGELEVARYLRERRDFAVALMDIDHFKLLNDTHGHSGGDQVLGETAWLIRSLVRKSDTVARIGGEEFVILLPGTPPAGAANLAENLRRAVEQHDFWIEGKKVNITASFGVALSGDRAHLDWEALLKEADRALYQAKHDGRNRCRIFEGPLSGEAQWSSGDEVQENRATLPS
ncbi:GGDEF domain-containing protein [Acidobacteria bacterium AB60]|nr:GGDEF domain-containing protein [Acidobacteria bacterium AB60]